MKHKLKVRSGKERYHTPSLSLECLCALIRQPPTPYHDPHLSHSSESEPASTDSLTASSTYKFSKLFAANTVHMATSEGHTMSFDVVHCSLIELINATDESIKSSLLERNDVPPQDSPSRKELLLAAIQCRDATNQNFDLKTPETAMKRVLAMTVD
ncbi:hypothetical protein BWQ96_01259 [Gracilariopsis chorda]|uniref:Uncharacterized protein n=1 Tax=Gracilariopsis chorda TaxID=448386 RepID=A0A2V3J4J7_9FLOR|nr:hypothetical protein BWQ96_01259 [Gracilariopsis chorda]|eukprot:PXF48917.1 hypothetical protein BWQ96_01259 [Gracilariopsis chorda]